MTDMCPTTTDPDGKALFRITEEAANENIFLTFVGIGVDFDAELTRKIGTIKGCTYLCVKSEKDFKKMMNEQFSYLVTPAFLDVKLTLKSSSPGCTPEYVYGSPGCEHPHEGELLGIKAGFPSMKETAQTTQGGVVLVKMPSNFSEPSLSITSTYKDRTGRSYGDVYDFQFPSSQEELFQGSAVRKAVLLTRYVNFMKNFIRDSLNQPGVSPVPVIMDEKNGIPIPGEPSKETSKCAKIQPLSPAYKELFTKFITYFEKEADILQDKTLLQELALAQDIMNATPQEAVTSLN